jgi:hypothetical protein
MALKLKLDDGTIKEYSTYYRYGGGENDYKPPICETKCGIKWNPDWEPDRKGCDHFDCAMYILEGNIKSYPNVIFASIGIMLFFVLVEMGSGMKSIEFVIGYSSIMIIILSILFRNLARESTQEKRELIEFRDHGTINGIKAHKPLGFLW